MRGRLAAGLLCGCVLLSACRAPSPVVRTTSIREGDCTPPPADVKARFEQRDLGVQQCPGAHSWDVLVVSSDANGWIELTSPFGSWSSERAVVYEMPIGLFPGVDADSPLEWRSDVRRGVFALLFTVSAHDPTDTETPVSRVFVARFAADAQVCLVGRAPTLDEARALADSESSCPAP